MSYIIGGEKKLRGFANKVFSILKTEKKSDHADMAR
jgi:hypothetical protein